MKKDVVLRWTQKAQEDLNVAKYLLELKKPSTGTICFHCQQAVEKYLKAYLTCCDIRAGKTHDLAVILNLCIDQDKDFKKLDREKISSLSFYAVEVRYPDEYYVPTLKETRETFKIASDIKDFILRKLKIKEGNF